MELKEFIVNETSSILEAMKVIDANTRRIVFVCHSGKQLVGSLSDGDVRRYILNGGAYGDAVTLAMNKSPVTVFYRESSKAKKLLEKRGISAIPLVDKEGAIRGIALQDTTVSIGEKLNIPVAIMAGGKGTRLYPYTSILPKPLIPVGEKSITEHIMDRFDAYGCSKYYMIVNYKRQFIESYFNEVDRKTPIEFVYEDSFRGTGGGLALLKDSIKETFFLTNCDILVDSDYGDILSYHREKRNYITLVSALIKQEIPYGILEMQGDRLLDIKEKPTYELYTNTGIYVMEPEILDTVPDEGEIPMTDIVKAAIKDGKRVGTYVVDSSCWMDMGEVDELSKMINRINVAEKDI